MKRKEFIKACGFGCAAMLSGTSFLASCAATKYVNGKINGSFLEVPVESFESTGHFIIQNDQLQYPIGLFKLGESEYKALYMRCTHQGTELQIFGDRLQCPAHGSEFTSDGRVQNGPADSSLRSFPVIIQDSFIKIDLS